MIAALGVIMTGLAGAQPALDLSPSEGEPGTTVTATQTVPADERCTIGSVTFGGNPVDFGSGAPGQVTFTVPDVASDPDGYSVSATCEDGSAAGSATFIVRSGSTTTTDTPTTTTDEPTPTSDETTPDDTTDTTDSGRPPPTGDPGATVPAAPKTIEECEEQAAAAESQLAYEPERQMVVGNSYKIQAALSLDALPPDVTFETPTTVVVLPDARCTVEANLTGSDFDITPDEPQPQSFLDTRVLIWEWQVSPKRPGDDLELTLRLQANVFEKGRTVPGRTTLSETTIDVDTAPVSFWSRLTDWSRGVFGHPIVPVLVVPAVGAAYVWLRRRYGHKQPPPPTPGPAHLPP
jgi:hypothetical protein